MPKTADQIIGPALDAFYLRRPKSYKHLNLRQGIYWHPFAAQRAQAALALLRLNQLIASNRLSATGQDLWDYVASEFTEVKQTGLLTAIGEVTFKRTTSTRAGNIQKGTRLVREEIPTSPITFKRAEYETLATAQFAIGQTESVSIPIRAVTPGEVANHPLTDALSTTGLFLPHGVVISGPVFDETITVDTFSCAGGSESPEDEYIRRFATASARGQFGPNIDASFYGALASTGVRNVLIYDQVSDGTQQIRVADKNWGSSRAWAQVVQQSMYDAGLVGFGCRVVVGPIINRTISINCSVTLRDWNFTSDTLEIDAAILETCRTYFDDRPDWHIWKPRALRNAITRAHPKILKCSSASLVGDGGSVVAPEIANWHHLYLINQAVSTTYVGPG